MRCQSELSIIIGGHPFSNPPTRVGVHSTVYYVASKIWFKIQNPKSKIRNPKSKIQNPKSKIRNPKFAQKEMLHNAPKSKIRNPKSQIQNPKSEIRNPKSKIQNPKSEIQNPKFGALGASHKELLHNDPKSKIPKIRPKKFGFWIGEFWILDSRFWGGPGDVPLANSVTVPGGQRLGSPLVRQLYLIGLGEERKRGKRGERRRELKAALWSQNHTYGQYMSIVLLQLGVTKGITKCKGMLHNDPKSKIPEIRPKKFGFWILDWGILDSGFWILRGSGGCTTRAGKASKAYIFPCFSGFYVQVWAIWSVFGGQPEGNQNQLYLIQLGEARKLGNRNERRREGKRWATLPPTVSDTVGFGYRRCTRHLMPGILDRMACGVALALAIGRRAGAADRQKTGSFLRSARCA